MLKRNVKLVRNHSSKRLDGAETESHSGSTGMDTKDTNRLDALDAVIASSDRLEQSGIRLQRVSSRNQMEETGHRLDKLGIDVYESSYPANRSISRVPSKLGLRRGSISYPDLFEGDISNLMCKKPLSSVFNKSDNVYEAGVEDRTSDRLTFKMDIQPRKRKLSEKIFSTWFFKKDDEGVEDDLSVSSHVEEDKRKTSLSHLVRKQFTASKDFRQLNITVPQSM